MTFKELLKKLGIADDVITKLEEEMKTNKFFLTGEENMDVRYPKLKADFDALTKQHGESTKLIEDLKKGNAGNEELQTKITDYEKKVKDLESELENTKIDSAIKVALLGAKVKDVDYLVYKLKEKNEKFTLDDKGNVKHLDSMISELETQFPTQFEGKADKKNKDGEIIENNLPEGEKNKTVTKDQFMKMGYSERLKLKKENPDLYTQLTKK